MHCSQCKRPFAAVAAFDKHLGGTPSNRKPCVDPATIPLLEQRDNGKWALVGKPTKVDEDE